MAILNVRIPKEMKQQMEKVKINWSDYVRQSINQALESEQKRAMIKKLHAIVRFKHPPKPGTANALIRQMRARG